MIGGFERGGGGERELERSISHLTAFIPLILIEVTSLLCRKGQSKVVVFYEINSFNPFSWSLRSLMFFSLQEKRSSKECSTDESLFYSCIIFMYALS